MALRKISAFLAGSVVATFATTVPVQAVNRRSTMRLEKNVGRLAIRST